MIEKYFKIFIPLIITSSMVILTGLTPVKKKPFLFFEGIVQDIDRQPIKGATAKLIFENKGKLDSIVRKTDGGGLFIMDRLKADMEYELQIAKEGYYTFKYVIDTKVPEKKRKKHFEFTADDITLIKKLNWFNPEILQEPQDRIIFDGKRFVYDDTYRRKMNRKWEKEFFKIVSASEEKQKRYRDDYEREHGIGTISGLFKFNEDNAIQGARTYLVNQAGELLDSTLTDEQGGYHFEGVNLKEKYLILIDGEKTKKSLQDQGINDINSISGNILLRESEPVSDVEIKVVKNMTALRKTLTDDKGFFKFEKLPSDEGKEMALLDSPDPELNYEAFAGALKYNDNKPVKGVKVILTNENKGIIDSVRTNENGEFVFERLPPDKSYLLLVDADDTRLFLKAESVNRLESLSGQIRLEENSRLEVSIQLVNKQLKIVNGTEIGVDNQFKFERLPSDKSEYSILEAKDTGFNSDLIVSGNLVVNEEEPLSGVGITLLNENKDIVGKTTTDEKGGFEFEQLPSDESYILLIDAEDTRLILEGNSIAKIKSLTGNISNSAGIGSISVQLAGKNLEPIIKTKISDGKFTMTDKEIEESGFKITPSTADSVQNSNTAESGSGKVVNITTIYFDVNSTDINAEGKKKLEKLALKLKENAGLNVELGGFTDPTGSKEYNKFLSNKRMLSVMRYLVSKGVDSKRISGKGYGEADGTDHKLSRKTECKVFGE